MRGKPYNGEGENKEVLTAEFTLVGTNMCVFTTGDKPISTWACCPNARQWLMLVSEENRFLLGLWAFFPLQFVSQVASSYQRRAGRLGQGSGAEASTGNAWCFPSSIPSAPPCLLCTYRPGREPRRESKYCETRWGFPGTPATAWAHQRGSDQDSGALKAPTEPQGLSLLPGERWL